jgi:hypothetical protein
MTLWWKAIVAGLLWLVLTGVAVLLVLFLPVDPTSSGLLLLAGLFINSSVIGSALLIVVGVCGVLAMSIRSVLRGRHRAL